MPIIEDYLTYTKKWKNEYGEKTLVLMQVGSFFEVYGLQNDNGDIEGSNIIEFSKICNMAIASKKQTFHKKQVMMAGFGISSIDKYIKILQNEGYVIPIYVQDTQSANTTRSLSEIVSPGTFFDDDSTNLSNNVMCIWLNHTQRSKYNPELMYIGVATIDNYTGKSNITQFTRDYHNDSSTYDDLERIISINKPYECIIISNMDNKIANDIAQYIGLSDIVTHIIDRKTKSEMSTQANNAEKQSYQQAIISRFFPSISNEVFMDALRTHEYGMQSFVMLVDFIHQHRPNLLNKISYPSFEHCSDQVLLANHTLKQLNIIDDNRHTGKLSSVSSLLNNCITPIGKRSFLHKITSPITDINVLNASYDLTELCLNNHSWIEIRNILKPVNDLERFMRKFVLSKNKTSPKDIVKFYNSIKSIKTAYEYIGTFKELNNYFDEQIICINEYNDIIQFIEKNIDINKSQNLDDISIDKLGTMSPTDACFILQGCSEKIDELLQLSSNSSIELETIKDFLSSTIQTKEKNSKSNEFVKIHETAKSDPMLVCTSRRATLLKSALETSYKNNKNIIIGDNNIVELDISKIDFSTFGSNKKDICIISPTINKISKNIQSSREKLIYFIKEYFEEFILKLLDKQEDIQKIINFTSWVDQLQNKCYIANKYNYVKPIISNEHEKSFFNIEELRHPLIEHLQTKELYVTNDLSLGEKIDGMLLYGTNAVGKTSFIRAIGIAIILAQAGLYVPCKSMIFKPYTKFFTRIIGNDNLFKGLSTFAVEMSELRTILNMCDENSLILGDELCSGTESDSARSIFTSGLEWLHNAKSSFVFATHFHEIQDYDEIKELDRMIMMHMAVVYNEKEGVLIYDRKLREGAGANMYGLEVCKALHMPNQFLNRSHAIRMKYDPKSANILSSKSSRYNSKKIKGVCEICGNSGDEVHHLKHQASADIKNYIKSHHKNHVANLLNICENCHDKLHSKGGQHRIAKTTNGYMIVED